jgi:hypothetical protein
MQWEGPKTKEDGDTLLTVIITPQVQLAPASLGSRTRLDPVSKAIRGVGETPWADTQGWSGLHGAF